VPTYEEKNEDMIPGMSPEWQRTEIKERKRQWEARGLATENRLRMLQEHREDMIENGERYYAKLWRVVRESLALEPRR
jgi:hypothetical protein